MPDVRMPDGTIIRNVPANATRAQIEQAHRRAREAGAIEDRRPTSFWRGFGDELQHGAANIGRILTGSVGQLPGQSIIPGAGAFIEPALRLLQARQDVASSRAPTRGSTAGKITGQIAASAPLMALPGGAVLQGALQGGALSRDINNPREVALNSGLGALFGKGGDVLGRRVVAPVAERVGRTRPVRATVEAATAALNKLRPQMNLRTLPNPVFNQAERATQRINPNAATARQNLSDAQRLGLPYALADADHRLRVLAGSVSRRSPEARALAEETFMPRSRGQAERAVNAIDTHLAPITDIEARSKAIKQAAWDASDPYYKAAFAEPAPIDEDLSSILNTPAGKQALARARTIAANEGRNPDELGFVVNDAGEVSLSNLLANEKGRFENVRLPDENSVLTSRIVRGHNGAEVPKLGPVDLVGWLRTRGGLQDQNGELAHMGFNNAARRMDFVGQEQKFGPLVNKEGGMSLDDAALQAWEAGYFPEMTDRPSVNEFLDAVRGTHEGWNRRFHPDDLPEIDAFEQARETRWNAQQTRFDTGKVPVQDMSAPAGPEQPFAPLESYDVQETRTPTIETIDLVKQGLDAELNSQRDALGNLNLEGRRDLQSINSLLGRLKGNIDAISPTYAQARRVYQEGIQPRTALQMGYKELPKGNLPQRDFERALSNFTEAQLPEAQRGYATAMDEQVDQMRLSGNPYEAVYGSPLQQGKVATLFPEGADNFGRVYGLERDMAQTATETTGGSQTAQRQAADAILENHLANTAAEVARNALAGNKIGAARAAGNGVIGGMRDRLNVGLINPEQRAAEMAPLLYNTDPKAALEFLDALSAKQAAAAYRRKTYQDLAGGFATPLGIAAGLTANR